MCQSKFIAFSHFIKLPCALVVIYSIIFHLFHYYDWGHPWVKALCFLVLFFIIIFVARRNEGTIKELSFYAAELVITSIIVLLILSTLGLKYLSYASTPAQCDIGYNTHNAAKMMVFDHQNPYKSTSISRIGNDPKFWGYHQGPAMILFYIPSAWFSSAALKAITVIYGVLLFCVIALLLHEKENPKVVWMSSSAFAILVMLIPERGWYELLIQGSTDIFPMLLILASVYLFDKKRSLAAGICAGLSFSAKFSPALFFIVLFLRKKLDLRFFNGVIIGCVPFIVFLAWSGAAMIKNVFLFHAVKKFDSTSLYSVTPASLHFIFPLIQLSALLFFLMINFQKEIETKTLVAHFSLLLILIEVTYREVHTNHLLWFIPLLALLLTWYRHPATSQYSQPSALSSDLHQTR